MNESPPTSASSAVHAHLNILQSVISRMANNSASCKTWCVTIVAAALALMAGNSNGNLVLLVIFPVVVFMALDCYYLMLENRFRDSYNGFVKKVHLSTVSEDDLFLIAPTGSAWKATVKSVSSFSIWPFYGFLLLVAVVVKYCVLVP